MLTVVIKGVNSPQRLLEVQQIVGTVGLYHRGTDPHWFKDYTTRERAHLDVANLNVIQGIKAEINGDR